MKKKTLTVISAVIVCLLAVCGLSALIGSAAGNACDGQFAWKSYGSSVRYGQYSLFLAADSTVYEDSVFTWRLAVLNALTQASVSAENDDARLTADAYSAKGTALLSVPSGRSVSVTLTGISADYGLFHPMKMISGSFAVSDAGDPQNVMIDAETAWELYGSYDVCGMEIYIDSEPMTVGGVFEKKTGKAYGTDLRAYIPYTAYECMYGDGGISVYEMLLPDPVSGFGLNIFKSTVSVGDSGEIYENSGRFGYFRLIGNLFSIDERLMRTSDITLPPYENEARAAEYTAGIFALITVITGACAGATVAVTAFILLKKYVIDKIYDKLTGVKGEKYEF